MPHHKIKTLIVDDEDLARQDLIDVLAEFEQINIVAEADSVRQARSKIEHDKPQLIFLDIQLPGESGFDLLEYVRDDIKIIFVTAYDQYAIRAFEVNAVDYLMKPVSRERLAAALSRIALGTRESTTELRPLKTDDRIFLKRDKGYAFIKIDRIVCIEAQDDYSLISLSDDEQIIIHKTMKEWEQRLPDEMFCRIHRSTIVNIEKVQKIDPWYHHTYLVVLEGREQPLVMSRRYFAIIKEKMA